ncbi:MAG: hypothetical protein IT312_08620 [Anaerolineales bacterium]|nr:hypothetical protein [Anaerolineales bacterium]
MTAQNYSTDYFIDLVEKMRKAQRDYFETKSNKSFRDALAFEKMVDAWLVARRLDSQKLAAWTGQKEN